jgi:hypothetical protein
MVLPSAPHPAGQDTILAPRHAGHSESYVDADRQGQHRAYEVKHGLLLLAVARPVRAQARRGQARDPFQ